jgi:hypothetical protein
MINHRLMSSFLFRFLIKLWDHPLSLSELRPIWLDVRRLVEEHHKSTHLERT